MILSNSVVLYRSEKLLREIRDEMMILMKIIYNCH